jgi:hypothetical protein
MKSLRFIFNSCPWGCVFEASTILFGVALFVSSLAQSCACLHAEAWAGQWNIASANTRRKKPGLLAETGLLLA